jgi:hypothetical protein
LQLRLQITQEAKQLEQEKQCIDEKLQGVHSAAELRIALRVFDRWFLMQKSGTTWEYSTEVLEVVKAIQKEAYRDEERFNASPSFTHSRNISLDMYFLSRCLLLSTQQFKEIPHEAFKTEISLFAPLSPVATGLGGAKTE